MIALSRIPRYVRTVRHLRASQVGWRLRYLVQRRIEAQPWFRLSDQIARRVDGSVGQAPAPHAAFAGSQRILTASRRTELQSGALTLLHAKLPFAGGSDWCMAGGRESNRLWRYKLHYHGWLAELAREYGSTRDTTCLDELRRWLVDWIETCRVGDPGFAHYPWNSYTIGERLRHWREINSLVPKSFWENATLPRARFLHSIAVQAEYLSTHIEWDLRGNHLFKDAVGLAVAAEMLGGESGARWRAQATELTHSQLAEQILPDGMHCERSPMYHVHVMEDLLTLQSLLTDEQVQAALRDALHRMAEPLRWLELPTGRIPLLNDAADHAVAMPDDVLGELVRRGIAARSASPFGLKHLEFAGIVAWHGKPWSVFFDVGRIGPDFQPGHAHADSLNVVFSFDGLPLVVDPGTYCYDDDDRRKYDRSTAAHNTVCLDDTDSSEVWHIFRVGRRAEPADVSVFEREDGFVAAASHTGYDHLSGSPRHHRRVYLGPFDVLKVHDEISGSRLHRACGGFLLDPEWTATSTSTGWKLHHRHCRMRVELHANQPVRTEVVARPWHPEFGREVLTQRIQWSADITPPFRITTTWQRG